MSKIVKIWSFIKTLRVEPYLFLHMFATSVATVTTTLLIQDKICVNVYQQSTDFCMNLNSITPSDDPQNYKNKVLKYSAQLGLYSTLLDMIPSVIWSLFIGSFTDKFLNGRKVVLCLSSIGGIATALLHILNAYYFQWNPYFLLLTALPLIITGGHMGSLMAVYSYVSINTPESMRSIRYTIVEFSFFLGGPLGTYVGGLILSNTPTSSGGQLHNYITIISISLLLQIISLILVMILINEKREEQNSEPLVDNEAIDDNSYDANKMTNRVESAETIQDVLYSFPEPEHKNKWYYPLDLLFDIENVREVWICCFKKRPNSGQLQIWLMFASMCVMLLVMMGSDKMQFQFSEKVYLWSATFYSNVHSIGSVVNSVLMTISVPILVVRLKLNDIQLVIVGYLSHIFRNIIIGSYQYPIGYYSSIVIGSFGGMIAIGIRSKLSKLVVKSELGKVFSLLATLESITPSIASLIFTFLFEWSLDFFPGLTYEVSAALMIIPLIALVWIELN